MKKIVKNTIFTILFLFFVTSTLLLTYLHFFVSDDKNLTGKWSAKLDVTEQAAVTAFVWLQDIEAVFVSLEDMENYIQNLTIEVNLNMEQTARSAGTFQCNISQESYDVCMQAAYEAFATVFQECLAERLRMAGYARDLDEEAIEALVIETFGMPTVSYLMSYGPDLLPSLEDLQAQYEGSGTYETANGILIRLFDTGQTATTKTQRYIRKDSSLILFEEDSLEHDPVIYTLQQSQINDILRMDKNNE